MKVVAACSARYFQDDTQERLLLWHLSGVSAATARQYTTDRQPTVASLFSRCCPQRATEKVTDSATRRPVGTEVAVDHRQIEVTLQARARAFGSCCQGAAELATDCIGQKLR